jgi:hypothetical protein
MERRTPPWCACSGSERLIRTTGKRARGGVLFYLGPRASSAVAPSAVAPSAVAPSAVGLRSGCHRSLNGALPDLVRGPSQVNEDDVRAAQPIPVAALERGTGDDSGDSSRGVIGDPGGHPVQPGPSVIIGHRLPGCP